MSKIQGKQIPFSFRNAIINGNFDLWQRGTFFANPANNTYNADRWCVEYDGTMGDNAPTRVAFPIGQTDVPGNPTYYMNWDMDPLGPGSGSTFRRLAHRIESVKTFAGKTVTLSFYAKSQYTSKTVGISFRQNFGAGGSPSAAVQGSTLATFNLTSSWQKFTLTTTIPSIAGKTLGTTHDGWLGLQFVMPLGVSLSIDLAQVMLCESRVALPFKYAGEDFVGEIEACQRYYEKSFPLNTAPATNTGTTGAHAFPNIAPSASQLTPKVMYKVTKRVTAVSTIIMYNPQANNNQIRSVGGTPGDWTSTVVNASDEYGFAVGGVSNGTVAGASCYVHWAADAELY